MNENQKLSKGKFALLGFQHMFAMFGATVLVPALTLQYVDSSIPGLSVSATLFFAGLGTLLFHLLTKWKVPAFLGSSFAFLGGYEAVKKLVAESGNGANWIPYAGVGVACAGLLYVLLASLFKAFGPTKVMRFFPPVVTGPIIICIGITLANSAVNNCANNWPIALLALAIVVGLNIWGKGMFRIIPILMGVVGSYAVAALLALLFGQNVDVVTMVKAAEEVVAETGAVVTTMVPTVTGSNITLFGNPNLVLFNQAAVDQLINAQWIGLPFGMKDTAFALTSGCDMSLLVSALITMVPIALATMMEHIGDICAISSTVGKNFVKEPGLHRTLLGDGLATAMAAVFGAPANTTYGENTGVLALTGVHNPGVVRLAAGIAILFSFSPKFAALVSCMPAATIGGVSMILYGMISAVGVRNVVENRVDFSKSRNVIIAAMIMSLALGINFSGAGAIIFEVFGATIRLSGLAVASLVGILLNAVLPGNDYVFSGEAEKDSKKFDA